ncbi:hypothetical protein BU17DRAFT_62059 [Hysterangium stoloniferum]|nr:hypothetical protein BU17DRAFT_62059 [Hysterangium stoloniferum]
MAPPTRRQKHAKSQWTHGAKCFNNGLIEDLLDIVLDPDYEPNDGSDSEDEVHFETHIGGMSFSLMDDSEVEEESVDGDKSGKKRNHWHEGDLDEFVAEETVDYTEQCAHKAAHHFWAGIMNSLKNQGSSQSTKSPQPPLSPFNSSHTTGHPPDREIPHFPSPPPTIPTETITSATESNASEQIHHAGQVAKTVKKLIVDAKKYKSFTSLFYLNSFKQFIELWEKYQQNPRIKAPMKKASHAIAASIGKRPYMARKIRKLYRYVTHFQTLPPASKGKHHAHPSLLNNERIAQAQMARLGPLGTYNLKITPLLLMKQPVMYHTDDGLEPVKPNLRLGEKLHIPLMHDKMIIHANDLQHRVYVYDGKMPLQKKGQGRAIHVSDFIVEHTGQLRLSETQLQENAALSNYQQLQHTDAQEIIYPGKNHDGWWTNDKLVEQVKWTIPIIKRMYPNAVAEFVFDQSSAHGAYAKNALNVKEMNIRPGGKQRIMHNTYISMDNPNPMLHGVTQMMVFPNDLPEDHPDFEFCGQAKGMRQQMVERQLVNARCADYPGRYTSGCTVKCWQQ